MVDVVDKVTRSRMMAGIQGKHTKPERDLRRELHRLGLRYRLHSAEPSRASRYNSAKVWGRNRSSGLFLASSQGLSILHQTCFQHSLLGGQVWRHRQARQAKSQSPASAWLESCYRLGMFSQRGRGRSRRWKNSWLASIRSVLQGDFQPYCKASQAASVI